MQIIMSLIVGLFVGVVFRLVFPARDPGGMVMTIVLALSGSAVAGALGRALNLYGTDDAGWCALAALIGATVVLVAYRLAPPRRLRVPEGKETP